MDQLMSHKLLLVFSLCLTLMHGCITDSPVIPNTDKNDLGTAGARGIDATSAGELINVEGGEDAGTIAEEGAGEGGGDQAGMSAGSPAGPIAGDQAGASAGDAAGSTAGDEAGEDAGDPFNPDRSGTQCEAEPRPIRPGGDCRLSRFSCGDEFECLIPETEADDFECGCLDAQPLNCCGSCERELCNGLDEDCDGVFDEGLAECEPCITLLGEDLTALEADSPLQFQTPLDGTAHRTFYLKGCSPTRSQVTSIQVEGRGFSVVEQGTPPPYVLRGETDDPDMMLRIDVTYAAQDERNDVGLLVIQTNDPDQPFIEVDLIGQLIVNECPVAQTNALPSSVTFGEVITLDATASVDPDGPDGLPVHYEWTLVNRPENSSSIIVEEYLNTNLPQEGGTPDDPTTPRAFFYVDVPGEYQFELVVKDEELLATDDEGICEAHLITYTTTTLSERGFNVLLYWDTPADDDQTDAVGTDLDLQLIHPDSRRWSTQPFSCYYGDRAPDWGIPGDTSDNPRLVIDDLNGMGPEEIKYENPESTRYNYQIGVHYYNNVIRQTNESLGVSTATLFIYFEGELVSELSRQMLDRGHFWIPAEIRWNGIREVIPVDRYYETIPPIVQEPNIVGCESDLTPLLFNDDNWNYHQTSTPPLTLNVSQDQSSVLLIDDQLSNRGAAVVSTRDLPSPFQLSFQYQVYSADGSVNNLMSVAEGLSVFFFKDEAAYQNQPPPEGTSRGFIYDGTGYGVHANLNTSRYAFLEDASLPVEARRLVATPPIDALYTHNQWNQVDVIVDDPQVQVLLNGAVILDYESPEPLNQDHLGFGISAATGDLDGAYTVRNVCYSQGEGGGDEVAGEEGIAGEEGDGMVDPWWAAPEGYTLSSPPERDAPGEALKIKDRSLYFSGSAESVRRCATQCDNYAGCTMFVFRYSHNLCKLYTNAPSSYNFYDTVDRGYNYIKD